MPVAGSVVDMGTGLAANMERAFANTALATGCLAPTSAITPPPESPQTARALAGTPIDLVSISDQARALAASAGS